MSNVPHQHQTSKEETRTGKAMVVLWSISFAVLIICSLYFMFDRGFGTGLVFFVFSFIPIFGIKAGKEAIERGRKREENGDIY